MHFFHPFSFLERLPRDADVHLLPGHGVADGLGKDACLRRCWSVIPANSTTKNKSTHLVRGEVLQMPPVVQVPRDDVGLDAGSVDLACVALAIHGQRRWEVAVAALVVALICAGLLISRRPRDH